jgi:tetratricopeptide (TPR) repeat protein
MFRVLYLSLIVLFLARPAFVQPPSAQKIAQALEHFNQGVKFGIAEDFDKATEEFEKAIDLNPLFAEAFLYKGLAEIEKQNYDQAVKDLTITIELDPGFSDQAHYFRGLARYMQGGYEQAIDDLSIAIRLSPDYVSFYQRGKANLMLNEYRRALQDFDIALRLHEDFHEAHLYRGIVLFYLDRYDEAVSDLQDARKHLPHRTEIDHYLALANRGLAGHAVASGTPPFNPAQFQQPVQATTSQPVNENNSRNTAASPQESPTRRSERTVQLVVEQPDAHANLPVSTDLNFSDLFRTSRETQQAQVQQTPVENLVAPERIRVDSHAATTPAVVPAPALNPGQLPPGLYNRELQLIPGNGFGVQLASYSSTNNLFNLSEAYAEKYNKPVFIHVSEVNGRKLYKLIMGQFANRIEAEELRDMLRKDNFPDSFLVVLNNL